MKHLLTLSLAVSLLWISPAPAQEPSAQPSPAQLFEEIGDILSDLSKITGLPAPKTVASDTITKAGLKKFLEDRIKELVKPEEIRAEETTLKKLGLVPADFDLKKMTIDLLTEQAAAFYDYQKKKLFVIESGATGPDLTQRPVLVHELAHALADVHFNLEKYILKGKNDDAAVARQAVMEGQATWLMSEYMLFKMGTSLRKAPEMADAFNQVGGATQGFPVFDSSPLYLRESLLFPYTKGFSFQQAVIQKYGDRGFREVFVNPPASVQQIIHPEKYFNKVVPTKPKLPKAKLKGFESLIEGGVGELEHQILLRLYAEDQVDLATKWRGGQVKILENRKTKQVVMLYASEWETDADAKAFHEAYQRILKGKKQEKAELHLEGRIVTSVE